MSGMAITLVIIATAVAVYNILVHYGVFEFTARPKKTVEEIENKRKFNKKRRQEQKKLDLYAQSVNLFRGIFMSDLMYQKHLYYIQRLELRSEPLDRLLTPEEVRGKRVLPFLLSLLLIPLALFFPVVIIVPILAFVNLAAYQTAYKSRIADEDEIIDNYFIDIYLLLYSKLRQGSRARLQGTVENYISTLESSKSTEESQVIEKLKEGKPNGISGCTFRWLPGNMSGGEEVVLQPDLVPKDDSDEHILHSVAVSLSDKVPPPQGV